MELLDKVINQRLENLEEGNVKSEHYKDYIESTAILLEQKCELDKIKSDTELAQLKIEVDAKLKQKENNTKRIEAGSKLLLGLGYVGMLGVGLVASLKVDNLGSIITSKSGNMILSAISKLKP